MQYHGRIFSVAVVILFNILRYYYYHQYLALPFKWNFFILTFIFLTIAWWCGKQFDSAKYYSERDPLTNTYNRRTLEQNSRKIMKKCDREKHSLGVIMLDLNNFKEVNDQYGHQKGDELLVQIASKLTKFVKKNDLVARWGGDEFVILVSNIKEDFGTDYTQTLLKKLKEHNSSEFSSIGASIGYAVYPRDGDNLQKLIQIADGGMYKEKRYSDK
ncbi:GGDEF domain-containing protein [Psychrobacillus soli]|uniref:GGDEF domain-containing protein n=1 Tax=Psychrobacillus soli TaxID=1543965 RepID=A0A544TMQ5_9BACI|nr:GGDEF domain-containing protein [Psychrobacillus soli]TQR18718.1 GGDEF domain-containing protein [Psychrobacillus soli]